MSVPIDNPFIQFLLWLLHTPGLGGLAVLLVATGSIIVYALALRWIRAGSQADELDTYPYPTPTLIHPHESES